jgi:hypothetical protein
MCLLFGTVIWPRERGREWEVPTAVLGMLFNPDLEDEGRSQDREGADKLLFRSLFLTLPLAEVGRLVSMWSRCGGGASSGSVTIAWASSGLGIGSRMNSGRVSIARGSLVRG